MRNSMKLSKKAVILLIVYMQSLCFVEGLRCYSCTMSVDDTDRNCEADPDHVTTSSPTVKCSKKFCYIKRIEYKDPKGEIFSFVRGCVDKLDIPDGEIEDEEFITYVRTCTTNLCNIGDGKKPIGGGLNSQGDGKIMGTIFAPGTGGSPASVKPLTIWMILGSTFISLKIISLLS